MRFIMKGGVWKNTEDEILKAAVMKYGKNQWGRISSLLVRKTAKQCKARWNEWLDPSIKKTEWSREEEERLLHLAKTMPNQWRTIAPLVGRTAAQCLQHYEKLLDAAQEQGGADAEAKDDPRKLRQGEIDPAPESRVPRPDPIDMDEDEKEMLNEARARLANTKGKKAKRKAREKQLMEAKRLASLQKRRELKAAGIESRFVFKKKNQMNYNAEIPFEKLPQGGFYDISEEVEAEKRMRHDPNFLNKTLHELDGKRRADIEEEARKKDAKRQKLMKEFMLPQYIMQIHKQTDPNAQVARPKLSLPAPNISDSDLQEIAKINAQGGLAASAGATPTRALLATYGGGSATPSASSTGIFGGMGARTPMALPTPQRTAATGDALMAEARAQLAMTQRSTPLVGGEMPEMAFGNAVTTGRVPAKTPQMGATPRLGMTPQTFGSAPATPSGSWESSEKGSQAAAADSGATLALKRRQASMKSALFSGLSALPAPRNEAVLAAPVPMDEEDTQAKPKMEEDAAEIAARARAAAQAAEEARLARRSAVLRRELPRPAGLANHAWPARPALAVQLGNEDEELVLAERRSASIIVREEMARLLQRDAVQHPMAGAPALTKAQQAAINASKWEQFADNELALARASIEQELAASVPSVPSPTTTVPRVIYVAARQTYVPAASLDQTSLCAALRDEWTSLAEQASMQQRANQKAELKIKTLTNGYVQRATVLAERVEAAYAQLDEAVIQRNSFQMLLEQEQAAIPRRVTACRRDLSLAAETERTLQARYAQLLKEHDETTRLLMQVQQQGAAPRDVAAEAMKASFVPAAH